MIKGRNNGNTDANSFDTKKSIGIGLSGQYSSAAVEVYYNLWSNGADGEKTNGW